MLTDNFHPHEPAPAIAHIPYLAPGHQEMNSALCGYSGKRRRNHTLNPTDSPAVRAQKLIENGLVTRRDYYLLKSLIGVGLLTRRQLQELFWQPGTARQTVSRRLSLLAGEERQLLISSSRQKDILAQLGLERCLTFGLSKTGRELIAQYEGRQSWRHVPYNDRYYKLETIRFSMIRHHLMTSEIYTRLKVKSNQAGNEMVWFNEMACILREGNQEMVRPDGYAVLWREGFPAEAHLFIETDTRHTDWEKKLQSYAAAKTRGNWRELFAIYQFPLVLCLVPSQQAVARIARLVQGQTQSPVTYLFKPWPQFLVEDPYTGWYHAQADKVVKILPDRMHKAG